MSGGCGSFYAIEISSAKFKGLGMVKQQKLVNEVLKDELKEIHGIQVRERSAGLYERERSLTLLSLSLPDFSSRPLPRNN